jgi:hypothetical protein
MIVDGATDEADLRTGELDLNKTGQAVTLLLQVP